MTEAEIRDGWFPDPFGRYDDRFFVYGEPSRLVRAAGIEATDPHGSEPTPVEVAPAKQRLGVRRFVAALRRRLRSRRPPAPSLPTVDFYNGPDGSTADAPPLSDDLDRLDGVAGLERVS